MEDGRREERGKALQGAGTGTVGTAIAGGPDIYYTIENYCGPPGRWKNIGLSHRYSEISGIILSYHYHYAALHCQYQYPY